MDEALGKESTQAFRKKDYATAVSVLKTLLQSSNDTRVITNLAIAEYYSAIQSRSATPSSLAALQATISDALESHKARDLNIQSTSAGVPLTSSPPRKSLDDDWAVSNTATDETADHEAGNTDDDEDLDPTKLPALPPPASDSAWTRYNRAGLLFYSGQISAAAELLTPLYELHVEALDDYIAIRVLLLLADVWLRLDNPQGVLRIAGYLERKYARDRDNAGAGNAARRLFVNNGEEATDDTTTNSHNKPVQFSDDEDIEEDVYLDDDDASAYGSVLAKAGGSQFEPNSIKFADEDTADSIGLHNVTTFDANNIPTSPIGAAGGLIRSATPMTANDSEGSDTGALSPTTPIMPLLPIPSPDRDPLYRPSADDALPSYHVSFRYTVHMLRGRALLISNRPKAANNEFRQAKRLQQQYLYHHQKHFESRDNEPESLVIDDLSPWHYHAKGEWLLHHPDKAMSKLDQVKSMMPRQHEFKETEHLNHDARPWSDKYWWNAMGVLAEEGGAKALSLLSFVRAHGRNTEHVNAITDPLLPSYLDDSPSIIYNAGIELLAARKTTQASECFSTVIRLLQGQEDPSVPLAKVWLRAGDCCLIHQENVKDQVETTPSTRSVRVGGFRIAVLAPRRPPMSEDTEDESPLSYSYAIQCFKNAYVLTDGQVKQQADSGVKLVMVAALSGWTYSTLMCGIASEAYGLAILAMDVAEKEEDAATDESEKSFIHQHTHMARLYAARALLDLDRADEAATLLQPFVETDSNAKRAYIVALCRAGRTSEASTELKNMSRSSNNGQSSRRGVDDDETLRAWMAGQQI
ncbi:hypothetical protein SmJEL517_g03092 [Synchytrium microbalum]|uniref:Uncharacterized protein n=1 Tax=Synchytrium microbalum TaxID=1806994 RepID=A0A507C9D8_9FUNG|nr:uncharacterized protein SmJEL517_g03092 [Synchytrium microbalum]TPX34163.1 hypothetical protein SmJEL517_g03092 [Synchytrium microbalum]